MDAHAAIAEAVSELSAPAPETSPVSDTPSTSPDPTPTPAASDAGDVQAPAPDTTAAAPEPPAADPPAGPIPFDRHKAILESTRQKVAEEIESRYAPLKGRDLSQVQQAIALAELLERDPDEFERRFRAVRGQAQPSAPPPPPAAPVDPMPEPDRMDGEGVWLYSAEQMTKLLAWQSRQQQAKVQEVVAPLVQERVARQAWEQAVARQAPVLQDAMANWPKFAEHKDAIAAAMQADASLSLEKAYVKVVTPKLVADREAMEREIHARLQADLTRKTTLATAPVAPTPAPRNYAGVPARDIVEETWRELASKG